MQIKLQPIATWSLTTPLHVPLFILSTHWLPVIFTFALIGRCDYFYESRKRHNDPKRHNECITHESRFYFIHALYSGQFMDHAKPLPVKFPEFSKKQK